VDGEILRDDQWDRLREFVPGGRWCDLPERFGPYQTAKRRYYRWVAQGVIDRIFEAVSDDPDIEWLATDATVIRAQTQAAGARIKRGGSSPGS
jgi:transposase